RDAGDAVAVDGVSVSPSRQLDKPEIAVGAGGDVAGSARRPWQIEFGDDACRRDSADLARVEFGKPEIAVRPGRNRARSAIRGRDRELGDLAIRRHAADAVAREFAEPKIAVGP